MIRRFLKLKIIILFLVLSAVNADSQNLIFTSYKDLSVFTNPGNIASDNKIGFNIQARRLKVLNSISYNSYAGVLSYPITGNRTGRRYGGIALSAYTDSYDYSGGLKSSGVALSYSAKVQLTYMSWLSLGLQGMYYQKGFDTNNFTTGSQWDVNTGFNPDKSLGEETLVDNVNNFNLNAGLFWHRNNDEELMMSYAGIAFYNITQPEEKFSSHNYKLPIMTVIQGGYRIFLNKNTTLTPSLLYINQNKNELMNFGLTYSFFFNNDCKCFNLHSGSIDFTGRYLTNERGSLGVRYSQNNYSMSVSYDFAFDYDDVSNSTNAFEINLGVRFGGKKKRVVKEKTDAEAVQEFSDSTNYNRFREFTDLENMIKAPEYTEAEIGEKDRLIDSLKNIISRKKVDFKLSVDLKFKVNDTTLSDYAKLYLVDLCKILQYNKEFHVKILGHADQTGSKKYNDILSQKRAEAVCRFVTLNGIDQSRLQCIGKGFDEPRYDVMTDEERAKNRRVEFIIFNKMNR